MPLLKVTGHYSNSDDVFDVWLDPNRVEMIKADEYKPGYWLVETMGCSSVTVGAPDLKRIITARGGEIVHSYNDPDGDVYVIPPHDQAPTPAPAIPVDTTSLEAFRKMLKQGDYVVLDTETTGLERGEICQIAIVDSSGKVLLESLVKTKHPIPPDATRIHGITDAMVAHSPTWQMLSSSVEKLLTGRNVVIYNAVYDRKMMHQTAEVWGMPKVEWKAISTMWCAMEMFAEIYGDWNSYRQSYRWQKLSTAAAHYHIKPMDEHSALGDCLTTLAVCKAIVESTENIPDALGGLGAWADREKEPPDDSDDDL